MENTQMTYKRGKHVLLCNLSLELLDCKQNTLMVKTKFKVFQESNKNFTVQVIRNVLSTKRTNQCTNWVTVYIWTMFSFGQVAPYLL